MPDDIPEIEPPKAITIFECGPNRTCPHDMRGWKNFVDETGRVFGGTAVCLLCGETAFNLSLWGDQ